MRIGLSLGIGAMHGGGVPSVTINASVTSGASGVTASMRGSGGVALYLNPRALAPGAVNTLVDTSGNGRDFDATGHAVTAEAAGGPNGTPDVRFNSTKYASKGSSPFAALTAVDFFAVMKVDAAAAGNGPWIFGTGDGDYYEFTDTNAYVGSFSSLRRSTGHPAQDIAQWHVCRITSTSSEYTLRIGTEQRYTTGTNTVATPATCTIGYNGATFLVGNLARFVIFDHKLSAAELASFKAGLVNDLGAVPGL